jgi:hypothetical protein
MIGAASEPLIMLDVSALTGTWKNTNTASRGVVRLDVAAEGNALRVTAVAGEPWGSTIANPYSVDGFECREALAFNCAFNLKVLDVRLQANIKAGVLVIAFLTRFHGENASSKVFTREFYYRSEK